MESNRRGITLHDRIRGHMGQAMQCISVGVVSSYAASIDTDMSYRHNGINPIRMLQCNPHQPIPISLPSPSILTNSNPPNHLPSLLPQLPKTNLLVIMFVQHLRRRQIEVLLRHVHPPFPERKHPRLGTHTLELGARAAVHLLGGFQEVDAPCQVHAAGVDAEDVGAGFDAVGGWSVFRGGV